MAEADPSPPAPAPAPASTTEPVPTPAPLFDIGGRVVIVTGATSGIGAHFAVTLAAAGARVVAVGRRSERLRVLAAGRDGIEGVAADVAAEDDRRRIVEVTLARHGRIDALVNNAGITEVVAAEDEPLERFRQVVETNLVATFGLAQLAGRSMLAAGRGSIVNIASVLGLVGAGRIPQASYTASKGGVVNLTRELAAQWAGRGVRVNAIAPGWFRSEMTAAMLDSASGLRYIERTVPMRRPGREDELDGALLFLISDASSYVTGITIPVDGGFVAL